MEQPIDDVNNVIEETENAIESAKIIEDDKKGKSPEKDVEPGKKKKKDASSSENAIKTLKKQKKGPGLANKVPAIVPGTKCKLRLLQLQRVHDFLQLETSFIESQEAIKKSLSEKGQSTEDPVSVTNLRGSPILLATLQEVLDDNHAIVSYVSMKMLVPVLSFVDRDLLEPGATVMLNSTSYALVGAMEESTNSTVDVMRVEKAPDETYADIGGLDEQIMEIKESVELPLTHPELYEEIGVSPPKGVILYGEPGTGKTLLAKAVANKTSATFLRLVGSELIQKYLGEGPKLVRDLFRLARDLAPSIVFIDEIDAVGTKRYEADSSGGREVQRTMLELLNQLDGFDDRGDVKVIMATNRIETLDPALLRPGRIDRKIKFPLPDIESKRKIFSIHTSKMSLDEDVQLETFIQSKDDLSGADIRAICMEAGMLALEERRMKVKMSDFEEAKKKTLVRKKTNEPEGLYM